MAKYQQYEEYKDSGVEWLGDIPSHWQLRRIQESANIINGYPFESSKFNPTKGTPLVRIRDIRNQKAEVCFDGFVPEVAVINNGDILIGMDGDFNVAKWAGGKAALNQRVACVRHENSITQSFLYYLLPFHMKIVNDLTYYTTVKHLSSNDILKTTFALPSEAELKSIVSFLDHETAQIDTLIEKQQTLIQLLKEKRQAVISHAVTKGLNPDAPMKDSGVEWLGEVPEHWDVMPAKRFFKLVAEPAPSNNDYELLSVYTAIGVRPRKDLEQKGNKASTTDGYWKVEKGDIVVNKLLAWMGAVGYSDYEGVTSPAYDILRATKDINSKFYHYLFRTKLANMEFKRWSRGIMEMRLRLYFDELGRIFMPLPSKKEQDLIVKKIEKMDNQFDNLIKKSEYNIQLMQERRTALISAAVTGKIDVRGWRASE